MIHFPQLKKLSETRQERLAIELAFLIYGFLDPYGDFWRDICKPRTPPGFLVVNALKLWLRGEANQDQCDRLARWMCEVGLFDRPLEDAFGMLWRINEAIALKRIPPSETSEAFRDLADEFRDRMIDLLWRKGHE